MRRAARLVGHDRHRHSARDLGHAGCVPARHGLLDEVEVIGLERPDGAERRGAVPALVGVDPERNIGADGLAQAPDALHVVRHWMRRRLDLEDAMAERDLGARLGHFGLRALDGERPGERHAVADAAAEQAVHGHAERLAVEVPERHLDRGAREGIALNPPRHLAAQRLDLRGVAPGEPRRDVALDRDRDRFRRLLAPRRAAQARGLTPAHEAVSRLDSDKGEVDRRQGREGHLVRALHRNVGEDHADAGDLHRAHSASGAFSRAAPGRSNRPGSNSDRSRDGLPSSSHSAT